MYHRGDVVTAALPEPTGSEQGGLRPVVIVQNDRANRYSDTFIVVPVTDRTNIAQLLPVHVELRSGDAKLPNASVVDCGQVHTIDRTRIRGKMGTLSGPALVAVENALKTSLGLR
jgi:mRNA interferase MazF